MTDDANGEGSNGESLYDVEERVTVAEAPGLRVRRLSLRAGESVPWHLHTEITDTFFCMDGPMQVTTREGAAGESGAGPADDSVHVLRAGETLAVGPGTWHLVTGVEGGACRFMIVQGVGTYDYVPLES